MHGPDGQGWELKLLGYWQLKRDGEPIDVGIRQQRLITALALLGPRSRHFLADRLWPGSAEPQATGSLRASVFQITHQLPNLLCFSNDSLFLDAHVKVDLQRLRWLMADIENAGAEVDANATDVLRGADLLPGWYEDWVVFEQEQLQQQRLEALETLANHLLLVGDLNRAIDAAHVAASIEPLRESAQLILLRGHLQAGNTARALHAFYDFRTRLRSELGVSPSHRFAELLQPRATTNPPMP